MFGKKEEKCFYCKKNIEKGFEQQGKKFCSRDCFEEYNKKIEKMLEEKNTCEFC